MVRMSADPHGAPEIGPTPVAGPASAHERMVREERRQVGADADRAHAGPASSVRDAERLVQVEMRDVGAELAGLRQADHGIQVGAVEIHLPARVVDKVADLGDAVLEHPVRGRVGDHEGAQVVTVRVGLGS